MHGELRAVVGTLLNSARQALQAQAFHPTDTSTLKCLTFVARHDAVRCPSKPEKVEEIKVKLAAWMSTYTRVPWDPKDEIAYILTNIHYFYLWLAANSFQSRYQKEFDPLISQFEHIISLAERFVFLDRVCSKTRGRGPSTSGSARPASTTGTHVTVTVCEIGVRCRDSAVRRRCMDILRALNLEGVCDGHFLASWIQCIMEIEETGARLKNDVLSKSFDLTCEDIPEEARVLDTIIPQEWDNGVNIHNFYKMAQSKILVAKYKDDPDGDIVIEETAFIVDRTPTMGKLKSVAWRSDVKTRRYVHPRSKTHETGHDATDLLSEVPRHVSTSEDVACSLD
ncbi:hypothetical protein M409DRAFT_16347 [Zasmidium cellare ATCC 36951]|uniref:Uncharacterized protein n=1 Tax=Zasmidium cellare ATCC 36951 TaxID=1080233 RepID=A0A6A6D4L6_ZASCE|nr:uncharacterized protein M409DRAFT_16347 [Zasmidium cellare ATCC 36951]KAF2174073.1 hypothetical protein M409DRAFT_16347 [Zasmidium cellare ATCC 36951]